jgi:hypothetical protein
MMGRAAWGAPPVFVFLERKRTHKATTNSRFIAKRDDAEYIAKRDGAEYLAALGMTVWWLWGHNGDLVEGPMVRKSKPAPSES